MNMVEIYINDQLIDLDDDEDIVQSYAVNKFGNISTRNSSYSNTFNLPITARNRSVFENPDILLQNTSIPYEQLDCIINVDGIPVVVGFAQLTSANHAYELRVFGTNFDFFSRIKSKKISELDLSAYDHTWNLANVAGSRTNTSGYIYGLIDYLTVPDNAYFGVTSRTIVANMLFPGMFLHTIIDKIISEAGFIKDGDLFSDPNYLVCVLPFSNDKFDRAETIDEDFKAISTTLQQFDGISDQLVLFQNDSSGGGFNHGGNYTPGTSRYTAPFAMNASFTAVITVTSLGAGGDIGIGAGLNGVTPLGSLTDNLPPLTTRRYTLNVPVTSLVAGDFVQIFISENSSSAMFISEGAYFESHVQADISWNTAVTMARTLPDITQADLLKCFLNMFQAIAQVKDGVVYVRKFSEISSNTANAIDWSDKIDDSEDPDFIFNMEKYAQINNFLYKDDDSVVKPSGTDYQLLIPNENLETETDIYESPFASTEMATRLSIENVPNIKKLTIGSVDSNSITNNVEPRILILDQRDSASAVTYDDPTSVSTVVATDSLPFMRFIVPGAAFNLGFGDNLIQLYGLEVKAVLQEQKIVTELIRLAAADINQLDFFLPVWIEKHHCYFFISNIKEYKINRVESTLVELVKLPS